jgi:MFS transporter, DHA2 family, multidrug resistance protein
MEAEAAIAGAIAHPDYNRHSHKWLIALAVMLGTTLEVLDTSIVNVALPHMQGSFSASVDEIAWVLTSYLVANGVMIPMTGWISARFGRKRYFLTSVLVFVVSSALCGAARSLEQMVMFRLVQGAAGAAMIPSSQAILMETFPPEEQEMGMAVWGVGLMVAPILGPTLGGWITDNWNWRWNFYINIPIGVIAFLMVSAFVHDPSYLRERRARGGHVDYMGIGLLAAALGLMQVVLDRGQRADWFNSQWLVYATGAAIIASVLLIWRELAFGDPIIDIRIFRNRVFSVAVTLAIWFSFVLFGTLLLNPVFLQELMGYTASKAGIVQAPRGLGSMFSMMVIGQLGRYRINTRPLIGVGFSLLALSLWVMSGWNLEVSMWDVVWPNALMGLGLGLIFPTVSALSFSGVPPERIGFASSLYNMMRNSGAAIGIAYMTSTLVARQQIYQSRLTEHLSIFDLWRLSKIPPSMPGAPSFIFSNGHSQSLGMLYGLVQQQASMLSFNDIYRTLAAATLIAIPTFLLMGGAKPSAGGSAH